jgi:hypothetical protein
MAEPAWTKNFSNEMVCNYYYYLSVAIMAVAILVTFTTTWAIFNVPGKLRGFLVLSLVLSLIQLGIGYFIYLFAYLVCARSLLK